MDAHSFRLAAEDWIRLLSGARVEKLYAPVPGVIALIFFAHGEKFRCILRWGRKSPLFFLSTESLVNPPHPDPHTMRLRKYAGGKRLGQGIADYGARSLAFPLYRESGSLWLLISLRDGARISVELPENFGDPPPWPPVSQADDLCGIPWNKRENTGPWRLFSVLTPFLRETLACLDMMEGRALLADLEAGGGDLFVYANSAGVPAAYSAWPLPQRMLAERNLSRMQRNEVMAAAILSWPGLSERYPCIVSTSLVDSAVFFSESGAMAHQKELTPERREEKRLVRLLAKLDGEETRLRGLLALREEACLLQANLWRFTSDARMAEVSLPADGGERRISLNPSLSVQENMARMFHQSARGARGIAMLERRRGEIREYRSGEAAREIPSPVRRERSGPGEGAKTPANVARFLSSDGYTLFRGKNAEGNHTLVKIGRPHDLWMHAADGPSAHLVIRRAHTADEVPERTLREAAFLVGMKSRQRNDAGGEVMMALVRHVHPVKGTPAGTVRVDKVMRMVEWRLADGSLI